MRRRLALTLGIATLALAFAPSVQAQMRTGFDGSTLAGNDDGSTGFVNFGFTIDLVTGKGTNFAVCRAATNFFSSVIAGATDGSQPDIFDELVANAIPNSRFVSAGVVAMTRAQEYGYSLLYAG